jgi:hypothetical protein
MTDKNMGLRITDHNIRSLHRFPCQEIILAQVVNPIQQVGKQ